MESVLALTRAVLVHLEAFTVIDLALHRDVVALFALGAFQGHFDPLVILGHVWLAFVFVARATGGDGTTIGSD